MRASYQLFESILRQDVGAFSEKSFYQLNPGTKYRHNWHIDVIADALKQCLIGNVRRVIINVPPRSLKSHLISISFVAWVLGNRPSSQIICASYGQDLADKLAADCRIVMTSQWYRHLFPGTQLATGRQLLHDFTTTANGCRLATSVGGVLTGRGADYVIIDDPIRPAEALSETRRQAVNSWFDHTLLTRLNDKNRGCIIIVMQRIHEDDLVGHVLRQGDWKLLKFPAIAEQDEHHVAGMLNGGREFFRHQGEALHPDRESLETLADIRNRIGEYNFAAQYQQTPAPAGGGLIKAEWFRTFKPDEQPKEFEFVFQSWDTASKTAELNDYTVCTTWAVVDEHLYLLDVFRNRLNYPDLRRAVKQQAEIYNPTNILIEDKASGTQLIQDLLADGVHSVTRYDTKMDKTTRVQTTSSTIENGFVHLPEQAHWLPEYLHEMVVFPNGRFDDQVDSTSQALDWLKGQRSVYLWAEFIPLPPIPSALERSHYTDDGWRIISR